MPPPNTKPWTEWLKSARVRNNDNVDRDAKFNQFRSVVDTVNGANVNEWLKQTTQVFERYVVMSPQDVGEVLTWIKTTMAAKGWKVDQTCQILAGFHLDAIGANGGRGERKRVDAFLKGFAD